MKRNTTEDPYGQIYKMYNDKVRPQKAMSSIRTEQGYTMSWTETAEELLNGLFKDEADPPPELEVEEEMLTTPETAPWTQSKVRRAVKRMRSSKCPGTDMTEPEMVKMAIKAGLLPILTALYNACKKTEMFP